MDYKEKDVVWVKLPSYPWWPAQVINEEVATKTAPVVYIKFFNEDFVEEIRSNTKIKPFDCEEKQSHIDKGLLLKNKEKKNLFIQAVKMATKSCHGNLTESCHGNLTELDKLFVHNDIHVSSESIQNEHFTDQGLRSCDHQDKKNSVSHAEKDVESCINCVNRQNVNDVASSGESKHFQSESQKNLFSSGSLETSPCSGRFQNMCSISNDGADHSRSNYIAFKSQSLQQRVDWNENSENQVKENNNEISSDDLTQIVDRKVLANGAKKMNRNFNSKKRKLTYEEECNEIIKPSQKKTMKDRIELSNTSTPKLCKNGDRIKPNKQSNLNVIKTFKKLSQKTKENQNVKPKRGRPARCRMENQPSNALMESESAKTPKSLAWNDSFELPTPALSQSLSCSSFLTNSSFDPNLYKDTCDSSSDSDTDLPEGLSPIVGEYPINEKDIVWLRWRKCPAWPAFVRKVYKKKTRIQKISLAFIEECHSMPKRLRVTYRSKCIVPFVDKQKDQFILEGESIADPDMRQKFIEACEIAENFLHKKALVSVNSLNKEEFSFFGESDEEEIESDTNEINPAISHRSESISEVEKRLSDSDSESDCSSVPRFHTSEPSAKELERLRKMTAKQENLVNFIKSEEMKKYLLDIFYKRKKSELHRKYFHGTIKEKNSLRYAGFGPIYNEEQEEEIVDTTKKWLYELPKENIPDISYILDVWIPEAVVYALIKVKGYGRKKAWEQFDKGVSLTKAEKERQHESMLEFVGYTAEEKQEVLEKAQQRMETFKYQHGLV